MRLEVELLEGERALPMEVAREEVPHEGDNIVLVSTDADLRRYVRECLRGIERLRVHDAVTVEEAVAVSRALGVDAVQLLVLDAAAWAVLPLLPRVPAIVVGNGEAARVAAEPRTAPVVALPTPFSSETLQGAVRSLLG